MSIAIKNKYLIKGVLTNDSPLLIGGGEINKTRDVAFVKDHRGRPYVPGTSLAGCLKSYFHEKYETENDLDFLWGQEDLYQAQFILEDAYLRDENYSIKIRDGVKINNKTGIAIEHGLYNYESLEPGSKFIFEAEITQRDKEKANPIKFLNTFFRDFSGSSNTFQIGALSSFGFGKMRFDKLEILEFSDVNSWIEYLNNSKTELQHFSLSESYYNIKAPSFIDIQVKLRQKTAFIARDYSQELTEEIENQISMKSTGKEDSSPDSITLLSNGQPILTGKTLKGAVRTQAVTIINTIKGISNKNYKPLANPDPLLDGLFGKWIEEQGDEKDKSKSLLMIEETSISNLQKIQLHQRVSIDRFTGGAIESKLFNSVPVYPEKDQELIVDMKLRVSKQNNARNLSTTTKAYLGLLLYIFRDLNDKLFSIGGEKSIGRGLFDVVHLKINKGKELQWELDFENLEKWEEVPSSWIKEFHNQLKN